MAEELAAGLGLRGVACTLGRFRGDPERFTTPEGRAHHLEDWEDRRTSHLLLIVSDARGLDPARRRLVLERLRHWPLLAWLDPREPRAWDAFTQVRAAADIPLYPATPRGVLGAVLALVGEQGAGAFAEPDQGPRVRAGLPSPPRRAELGLDAPGLAAYLEQRLGDALPWAQSCALVQPIPPGLAERLRERFFPDLPAAAIERLHKLPGTGRSVAGLHFALEVQGALRQGFAARWDPARRRAVIDFLLAQIDRARPDADPDSLRLLAWELARERLALEGEPENPAHARRLAELAESSLGDGLRDALVPFGERLLPLLGQPSDPRARAWLSGIAGDPLGLGRVRRQPLGPERWAVAGFLGALALENGGLGYHQWRYPAGSDRIALNWQVQGEPPGNLYTLIEERLPGEPWRERTAAPGLPVDIDAAPWDPEREYRLALVAGGTVHPVAALSEPTARLTVALGWGERPRPCREPTGAPGLERRDCPDDIAQDAPPRAGWRQRLGGQAPEGRVLSIALAVQAPGRPDAADALGSRLLAGGSVDRVYRLTADPGDPRALDGALGQIAADLGPALGHAQLLVYGDAAMLDRAGRTALGRATDGLGLQRRLILPGASAAWDLAYAPVLRLLEPGETGPVTESELLGALGAETAGGAGVPVVLICPGQAPAVFHDTLKDGSPGPAMVRLRGGTFTMGSPADEPGRFAGEGPRHEVRLQPFAIGRTEVTFADYDRFAQATGRTQPASRDRGRGERPVIDVSWQDANAYAVWLAEQTGKPYRLPSEAEWEYAARADTQTPFWTGACIHTDQANYDGNVDYNDCGAKTGVNREETVPVGSLPANPWGFMRLRAMSGNGYRTLGTPTTRAPPTMAALGRTPRAASACCVAAVGLKAAGTPGRRAAAASIPVSASTTSASGCPEGLPRPAGGG
nr:formylglycine-generating enzyme family protein [uncultured Thiodictyon sp.]